jgi:chromosome segregation ATPase
LLRWKNAAQLAQFELETLKKRASTVANLTSVVTELSTVLDRKKLLMESLQDNAVSKLTIERDELSRKLAELDVSKNALESELRTALLNSQNECTRLTIECEMAQKLVGPLEIENKDLRAQCRELTDDLIANQKLIGESQMSRLNEKVATGEADIFRKQLDEALSVAQRKFSLV